jgi:hypothetical protein
MGSYKIRLSSGGAYIHVPAKLVAQLGMRRAKVIMQIDSRECADTIFHGSVITFPATLTRVGDTFRVKIPKKFVPLVERVKDCATVDVWLEPLLDMREPELQSRSKR